MMNPPNKMQTPAQPGGVCPVCRGQKIVHGTAGKTLTCHACRGTGKASSQMRTK